jgi:hypothetical protein
MELFGATRNAKLLYLLKSLLTYATETKNRKHVGRHIISFSEVTDDK